MPQEARDAAMAFKVAGRVEPRLAISLLAMTIRERRDGLASLSATFGALGTPSGEPDLDLMDRKLLDYGAELEVQHQDTVVFKGKITCLSAQFSKSELPSLTVLAEDACQDLRMTRRTRVFVDVTDADLARRIGQEHGLDVRVDADDGPTWPQLAQLNESDLAFLRRRALSAGLDLWVSDGRLNLRARDRWSDTPITLSRASDLLSVEIQADLAHQRTSVKVGGWSVADRDGVTSEATDSALGSETRDGESGASILRQKFGARPETLAHTLAGSGEATRAEAEALMRTLARRFVVADGVTQGDPRIRVGQRVDLRGVSSLFEGVYAVVATELRCDTAAGVTTSFQAERPWIGRVA